MKRINFFLFLVLALCFLPGPAGAATLAYVANTEGTNLFTVDADSKNGSFSAFDIGSSSSGIAVRPQNDRVYVSDTAHDRLVIVDRNDGNSTSYFVMAAGSRPTHLEMNRQGTRLYVANSGNKTVSELDISQVVPKSLAVMSMGDNPGRLVLHPSGKHLFVLVEKKYGDCVSGFNLAVTPHTRVDSLAVSSGSTGLAVSPDGTRLFVVSPSSDRIVTFDLLAENGMVICKSFIASNAVNAAVDVAFNAESTRAYALNTNGGVKQGDISIVDISRAPAIVLPTRINVCFDPEDLAIDSSGTRLAITSPGQRVASVVNLTASPVYDTVSVISQVTGDVTFRQAPVAIRCNPEDCSGGNQPGTIVSATFSEDMNPATVTRESFTLLDGADRIDGEVSCNGRTATFIPSKPLSRGKTYTATLTGVITNAAGIPIDQTSWKFYTGTGALVFPGGSDSDSGCFIRTASWK